MSTVILDENDKKELEKKIEEAAKSAGTDGGHYTPSVKDNADGTMTVSFTASKDDMAAVSPVTVTLPKGANGAHVVAIDEIGGDNTKTTYKMRFSDGSGYDFDVYHGYDGVGIESIVQTTTSTADDGENIITVTLTNGNKYTFKIKNGSKGGKGDTGNGIKSIAKTSTSGQVDTYTITFTDNTTTTFTVTNGKVGTNGKSAYQYAQDGGYTGTESEFAEKLATKYATPEQVQEAVESATAGTDSFIIAEGTGGTTEEYTPDYDNLANPNIAPVFGSDGVPDLSASGWLEGYRTNSSGVATKDTAVANCFMSNLIPISQGQVLRIRGVKTSGNAAFRAQAYGTDKKTIKGTGFYFEKTTAQTSAGGCKDCTTITTDEMNGMSVYEWTAFQKGGSGSLGSGDQHSYANQMMYVRVTGAYVTTAEDVVITVDDPITYTKTTLGEMSYTLDKKVKVPQAIENAEKIASMQTGAVWYALGDSITEGYMSAVDSSASIGYKSWKATSGRWVDYVAQLNGYQLTNKGVGGTGYVQSTNNARVQVDSIDFSGCDLVTLAYGVNDWKYPGNTIGSLEDNITAGGTMVSNLRYIIKKILTDNPYCKIFVITPINCRSLGTYETNWGIAYAGTNSSGGSLEDIFTAIKSACEYHGIEMIDMTHSSIVNRENIRTALADYVHPTAECHKVMGYELARKIKFA